MSGLALGVLERDGPNREHAIDGGPPMTHGVMSTAARQAGLRCGVGTGVVSGMDRACRASAEPQIEKGKLPGVAAFPLDR